MKKPLHVQVAEALGCDARRVVVYPSGYKPREPFWECGCRDRAHMDVGVDGAPHEGDTLLRYDIDWDATGPLIEKHRIALGTDGHWWYASLVEGPVCDHVGVGAGFAPCADRSTSPLVSVCLAILEAKKGGAL